LGEAHQNKFIILKVDRFSGTYIICTVNKIMKHIQMIRRINIYLVLVLIAAVFFSLPSSAEEWAKDPITGCDIWGDKVDTKREIASWSGSCSDGKASGNGVLVWFKDGKLLGRYDGMMKAGFLDGHGVLYYHTKDGFDRYEGEFKNGELDGELTYVGAKGDSFEGTMKSDREDNTSGKGVYIDVLGDRYEGDLKNGLPNGQGNLKSINGDEYKGSFRSGKYDGKGELIYLNGDRYTGEFQDGEPNGNGIFKKPDGERFEGSFKNGAPHGQGKFTDTEGHTYEGLFINDAPTGKIIKTADGKKTEQLWKDGKLVE